MRLEDISIILVRPSEPGNIGAVCRAMKNMGLARLAIAGAFPAEDAAGETILARAVHAAGIWETAERFDSLGAALADCTLSAGTTRRRGRHRKSTLNPRELAEFLKTRPGKAAIVFGNERTGLESKELELCDIASHIPVSPVFPSINLSHAVQIYAYELYGALAEDKTAEDETQGNETRPERCPGPACVPGQWTPMTRREIEALVADISASFESLGFYKHPGREKQEHFLRDMIGRAGLGAGEGRYLRNIIVKAGRLNG